jgi:hypothetical protein
MAEPAQQSLCLRRVRHLSGVEVCVSLKSVAVKLVNRCELCESHGNSQLIGDAMRRSPTSMFIRATAPVVALCALSACHNGSNNGRDTTAGMTNSAAAGQVAPGSGGTAAASASDTTKQDSTAAGATKRDTTKPRP